MSPIRPLVLAGLLSAALIPAFAASDEYLEEPYVNKVTLDKVETYVTAPYEMFPNITYYLITFSWQQGVLFADGTFVGKTPRTYTESIESPYAPNTGSMFTRLIDFEWANGKYLIDSRQVSNYDKSSALKEAFMRHYAIAYGSRYSGALGNTVEILVKPVDVTTTIAKPTNIWSAGGKALTAAEVVVNLEELKIYLNVNNARLAARRLNAAKAGFLYLRDAEEARSEDRPLPSTRKIPGFLRKAGALWAAINNIPDPTVRGPLAKIVKSYIARLKKIAKRK